MKNSKIWITIFIVILLILSIKSFSQQGVLRFTRENKPTLPEYNKDELQREINNAHSYGLLSNSEGIACLFLCKSFRDSDPYDLKVSEFSGIKRSFNRGEKLKKLAIIYRLYNGLRKKKGMPIFHALFNGPRKLKHPEFQFSVTLYKNSKEIWNENYIVPNNAVGRYGYYVKTLCVKLPKNLPPGIYRARVNVRIPTKPFHKFNLPKQESVLFEVL